MKKTVKSARRSKRAVRAGMKKGQKQEAERRYPKGLKGFWKRFCAL